MLDAPSSAHKAFFPRLPPSLFLLNPLALPLRTVHSALTALNNAPKLRDPTIAQCAGLVRGRGSTMVLSQSHRSNFCFCRKCKQRCPGRRLHYSTQAMMNNCAKNSSSTNSEPSTVKVCPESRCCCCRHGLPGTHVTGSWARYPGGILA